MKKQPSVYQKKKKKATITMNRTPRSKLMNKNQMKQNPDLFFTLGIAGLHSFQLPWLIKKMKSKTKTKTAIPDNGRQARHNHNPFEGCLLTVTGNPEYSSALRLILRYRPGELFSQENFDKKAKKLLFCGGGGRRSILEHLYILQIQRWGLNL